MDRTPRQRPPTVSARAPRRGRSPGVRAFGVSAPASLARLGWLKREAVALVALSGAALTVIGQLAQVMPTAPLFSDAIARWRDVTHDLWRPPLDALHVAAHPDIVAALSVALFMALLGIGARISARLAGDSMAPIDSGRFFDDQTWPSLIVFAALCFIFLVGDGDDGGAGPLSVMGSEEIGKYAFAIIVTAGYFAGDFIGHRAFHLRLYRLAAIVVAFAAVNVAVLQWG